VVIEQKVGAAREAEGLACGQLGVECARNRLKVLPWVTYSNDES
jgi:hypothetical protein